MFTPFLNEPYVNFTEERPRRKMTEALEMVGRSLGRTYHLTIGGEAIETDRKNSSRNPAKWTQVIGHVCEADADLTDKAVQAADRAFPDWSRTPAEVRARILIKAAAI